MKRYLLLIHLLLFILPLSALAGWQVSNPAAAYPREPFFEAGLAHKPILQPPPAAYSSNVFPNQYANLGQPATVYAISISGSLKQNVERIMCRYRWRVIWKSQYDYNFDGRVTGSNLPNVIEKLFAPFPLQAVMYMSNRTLMVVERPGTDVPRANTG